MSEIATLGAPVNVSPSIRLARWALLGAGVVFGAVRYNSLKKREEADRAYRAKMMPVWTAQRQAKLDEINKKEMDILSKEIGQKI